MPFGLFVVHCTWLRLLFIFKRIPYPLFLVIGLAINEKVFFLFFIYIYTSKKKKKKKKELQNPKLNIQTWNIPLHL